MTSSTLHDAADIGERDVRSAQRARLRRKSRASLRARARPAAGRACRLSATRSRPIASGGSAGAACEPCRLRQRELPQERRMIGDREQEIAEGARLQMRQEGCGVRRVSARSIRSARRFGALPIRDGAAPARCARRDCRLALPRPATFDANCHGLGDRASRPCETAVERYGLPSERLNPATPCLPLRGRVARPSGQVGRGERRFRYSPPLPARAPPSRPPPQREEG